MRFGRLLRTFSIAAYLCIIILIALWHSMIDDQTSFDYDSYEIQDSRGSQVDEHSVFGGIPQEISSSPRKNKMKKIILMWYSGEIGPQHLGGCPEFDCAITDDRQLLNQSHAVVFHNGMSGIPTFRAPWQFYVFFTQESPMHTSVDGRSAKDFFNLTLGYRRDADIPCPYGYVIKRKKILRRVPGNLSSLIAGKNRSIAWFVSNCGAPSGRDKYVSELRKYIDVDIFGGCGTMHCSKETDCNGLLERQYKFYLAFENSLCKDYATEKFWEKMTLNIVVIVLKRSVISNHAPHDSFIAVDDFDSPRSLAEYLNTLMADPNLYAQRFEWKRQYEVVYLNGRDHNQYERPWCFCKLCKRLWETPIRSKSYKDLNDWWSTKAECDSDLVPKLLAGSSVQGKKSS